MCVPLRAWRGIWAHCGVYMGTVHYGMHVYMYIHVYGHSDVCVYRYCDVHFYVVCLRALRCTYVHVVLISLCLVRHCDMWVHVGGATHVCVRVGA